MVSIQFLKIFFTLKTRTAAPPSKFKCSRESELQRICACCGDTSSCNAWMSTISLLYAYAESNTTFWKSHHFFSVVPNPKQLNAGFMFTDNAPTWRTNLRTCQSGTKCLEFYVVQAQFNFLFVPLKMEMLNTHPICEVSTRPRNWNQAQHRWNTFLVFVVKNMDETSKSATRIRLWQSLERVVWTIRLRNSKNDHETLRAGGEDSYIQNLILKTPILKFAFEL